MYLNKKIGLKFVCAITMYHPNKNALEKPKYYEKFFDEVYIFDNTEQVRKNIYNSNKIKYYSNGKNNGLPVVFNLLINKLDNNCILCLLDQDSSFYEKDIKAMKDICITMYKRDKNFTIIGPKIIYNEKKSTRVKNIIEKKYIITSGSFININELKKQNISYDEKYFIDRTEVDICKQLREKHNKIYMYEGAFLEQVLGENNGHSALRHYYIFRNRFYYNNKFYNKYLAWIRNLFQTCRHIYHIVIYEKNKKNKIKMLFIGYRDYKNGLMWKKEE